MDVVLDAVAAPYIFPLLLGSSPSLHLSSLTPLSLPPTDKDKCCGGLSFLRRCPWGPRHHISPFRLFDDVILFPHCNRFVPNGSIYPWSTLAPFYSPLLIPRSSSPSLCLSQLVIECFICFFCHHHSIQPCPLQRSSLSIWHQTSIQLKKKKKLLF